jgi:hypothetical protein
MRLLAAAALTVAGLIFVSGPTKSSATVPPPATGSSGVMVLDSAGTGGALTLSGNAQIRCPIMYVNSSSNQAVRGSGSVVLDCHTLNVVGNASFNGGAHCTGTVNQGFPGPAMDPNAGTAVPAADTAHDLGKLTIKNVTATANPGYYSGGISTSSADVTFNPGIYVLGSDLTVSNGSVSGAGVCFVMLGGRVTFSGTGTASLTPPASGALAGIVIAQPASNTGALTLSGGSGISIQGTIWMPGSAATVSGSSSVAGSGPLMGDMLVCKRLTVSGSGLLIIGRPLQAVVAPQLSGQYD